MTQSPNCQATAREDRQPHCVPTESYILEMRDIDKSFYGVQVLDKARLRVRPGEVHVLLGENGAGKSTLIKILSGAYRREGGEIFIDGKPFCVETPKETLEAGISVIYQEFNLVPHLPIYENIFLGKEYCGAVFINKKRAICESMEYMEMIGLNVPPETLIADLSVAQKQLVEIAKAISNDVRVLVLDEPTAAITDKETRMLFDKINDLKSRGMGIVYISHRLQELFEIGDRCTVMRDGRFVDEVCLDAVTEGDLTRMMVGREVKLVKSRRLKRTDSRPVLEVRGLCCRNRLHDIDLTLEKGEILGVSGLVGAGRSELARCIIGDFKRVSGSVKYNGEELVGGIHDSIAKGVVYLSEDRKDAGLVLVHSVADNIALPNLRQFGKVFLRKRSMVETCRRYVKDLRIRPADHRAEVKNLSGGNQQKVVIAKWLCSRASVYIFDEPTRGIDVGARDEIYGIMERLVAEGASIIMISSDMVELMKMCDRIAVMREGRIATVLDNDDGLTQETLLSHALGSCPVS